MWNEIELYPYISAPILTTIIQKEVHGFVECL